MECVKIRQRSTTTTNTTTMVPRNEKELMYSMYDAKANHSNAISDHIRVLYVGFLFFFYNQIILK